MVVRQGEVYWFDPGPPIGSGPGYRHPFVVIQNDAFNDSPIRTVVVCQVTSKPKRGESPGNVLLAAGEANLPRRSVVHVSQIFTVDKAELTERVGQLSPARVRQVVRGINLLLRPTEPE